MKSSFSYTVSNSYSQTKQDKAMTNEQFEQIVEAILSGKYSWACVLILRFAGYNPLHYIPYRTYNRLIKDHCLNSHSKKTEQSKTPQPQSKQLSSSLQPKRQIEDLKYIEDLDYQEENLIGGFCRWFF